MGRGQAGAGAGRPLPPRLRVAPLNGISSGCHGNAGAVFEGGGVPEVGVQPRVGVGAVAVSAAQRAEDRGTPQQRAGVLDLQVDGSARFSLG